MIQVKQHDIGNFRLSGGRYILDFRRIPWPDPYPGLGDGASVAGFIR